jgi:hypothetical protein
MYIQLLVRFYISNFHFPSSRKKIGILYTHNILTHKHTYEINLDKHFGFALFFLFSKKAPWFDLVIRYMSSLKV